ncbi:MAG: Sec-independent protein translocase protein TatAy [Pelotomaculum sp. PtaB.Bin013]|uniref:Sec-independent protein translocase protein TatA n=1 Tax=Pelotomaculum isophthalicicum JI TaxID=947010 RepID=A0A9X4H8A7_9FIRM|nr:twin-arginine translocase TatA/TatE family subunit [Pelotomaculum isophthalicicum]MDF9408779.1 twin-arginine translocase TatA/TatE family subunit [Pelotomaculum isophthalicicum JI]OPX91894.1 MAG: Sec-independent protein translocase protein TatAy [Pelotomaculum sp. PtaB.Bin013]
MFSGLLQPMHIILILIIVLIIFGPGKLPDAGKALGRSIREFRRATSASFENEQEEAKKSQSQSSHAQTQESE